MPLLPNNHNIMPEHQNIEKMENKIQLFEKNNVRSVWDEEQEKSLLNNLRMQKNTKFPIEQQDEICPN